MIGTVAVHGIMGPLRQFLTMARPWERVVVGVVLAVVGALLGIYIVSAIGVVLVLLVIVGWSRSLRGRGASGPADTVVPAEAGVPEDVTKD